MKLDKIRFASLVGFISCRYALTLTQDDMREIDELIDVELPQPEYKTSVTHDAADVNKLIGLMSEVGDFNQKLEAIRLHRKLTGSKLTEAKNIVEAYWKYPVKAVEPVLDSSGGHYTAKAVEPFTPPKAYGVGV